MCFACSLISSCHWPFHPMKRHALAPSTSPLPLFVCLQYLYNPVQGGHMSTNVDNSGTERLPFNTSLTGKIEYRVIAALQPKLSLQVTGTVLGAGASVSVSATLKPYVGFRVKASSWGYKPLATATGLGKTLFHDPACERNHSLEVLHARACVGAISCHVFAQNALSGRNLCAEMPKPALIRSLSCADWCVFRHGQCPSKRRILLKSDSKGLERTAGPLAPTPP